MKGEGNTSYLFLCLKHRKRFKISILLWCKSLAEYNSILFKYPTHESNMTVLLFTYIQCRAGVKFTVVHHFDLVNIIWAYAHYTKHCTILCSCTWKVCKCIISCACTSRFVFTQLSPTHALHIGQCVMYRTYTVGSCLHRWIRDGGGLGGEGRSISYLKNT